MIKSTSVMNNIQEVCAALRKKYYGEAASPRDYKDSYIVNRAIESFKGAPEDLMTEAISQKDRSEIKVSKSISYRSDIFEKLQAIAKTLQIQEPEACRRILYYSLEERDKNETVMMDLSDLKAKTMFLKKQMECSMAALNEVILAITLLENNKEGGRDA